MLSWCNSPTDEFSITGVEVAAVKRAEGIKAEPNCHFCYQQLISIGIWTGAADSNRTETCFS